MERHSKTARKRERGMVSTETDRQDFVVRSYATGCCHGNVKEGGGDRLNVHSEFTQCSDNARYPWCERGGGKRRSNGVLSCHQIIKMSINKAGSAWKLWRGMTAACEHLED